MSNQQRILALLGQRDEPTDAIEEYCRYLTEALRAYGIEMNLERVPWKEQGWTAALRQLQQHARDCRGQWIFLQYTALAWSSRGFPHNFLRVLNTLRRAGASVGVVYHDVEPYYGKRLIDRVRRFVQLRTMRATLNRADLSVFTVSPDAISWLGSAPQQSAFIPVAANLPLPTPSPDKSLADKSVNPNSGPLRIVVFGISGGAAGHQECSRILHAVRFAAGKLGRLELSVFGRNAKAFEAELEVGLRDASVELRVQGVLVPTEVIEELSCSDVMLFVRGAISTRRSSAIAGIACGLPVVAFKGSETAPPITEAGLVLVTPEEPGELGSALVQVLANTPYRQQLAQASRNAQEKYFSWIAIAARYTHELQKRSSTR